MATAASVKAKIIGLIDKSNATTGNTDADLTTAVDALVEGYGKGGSTVETQEKTVNVTENGTTEVLPDEGFALSKVTVNTNVASVGDAPKLNAPTLNLALSSLLIEAADNGSFDDGYRLYIDGVQVAELAITTTTVDLTTYISEEGDYTISVVCYGDGFEDSDEASVTFSYVLRGVSFLGEVGTTSIKQGSYDSYYAESVGGEKAIFASGNGASNANKMNCCDEDFTISTVNASNGLTRDKATASLGDYAIFVGGVYGGSQKAGNVVTAYDLNMTESKLTSIGTSLGGFGRAYVDGVALFAFGATDYAGNTATDIVEAFDTELVRRNPVSLSVARVYGKAGSSKSMAIFYGGKTAGNDWTTQSKVVDAFDKDLTRTTVELSLPKYRYSKNSAGRIGDYAIFINGYMSNSRHGDMFALDDELTHQYLASFDDSSEVNVVTVGDYAICPHSKGTAIYDIALTLTTNASTAYLEYAGTHLGDYALYQSSVDTLRAYQVK
jgi:hypothetical protein